MINNGDFVTTEAELRALIGYPSELVQNKSIQHLDEHCLNFIAKSPFVVISTADSTGRCDVSPRGDSIGFVKVIDEHHLLIPERPGNKRMDTLCNILSNDGIGLLFLIPQLGETLRINGRAAITKDRQLLEIAAVKGIVPLLGVIVAVEECFLHCAKALIRSELWKPESWLIKNDLPSASRILAAHVKQEGITAETIAAGLEESYTKRLY